MNNGREFVAVISSNIRGIAYDEITGGMAVEFTNGSTYEYSDVPKQVYEDFVHDGSPGSYFHNNIKGVYRYARV